MSAEQPIAENPFADDADKSLAASAASDDVTNPYAAPVSTPEDGIDESLVWRDEGYLVIHRESKLPAACIKCGTETRERFPYRLSHFPLTSWEFRPFTIFIGFCPSCRVRHRVWKVVQGLAAFAFIGSLVMLLYQGSIDSAFVSPESGPRSISSVEGWQLLTVVGFVLLVFFVGDMKTLSLVRSKFIAPKVWLSGASRDFLEQLPPLPQQAVAITPFDSAGS